MAATTAMSGATATPGTGALTPPSTFSGESMGELWRYRELLYFFAWRDIKVRYRQAAFGAAWAIIQPVTAMAIFTLVFSRLAHLPSDGVPYQLFAYCGLLPWTYFSGVIGLASNSLVSSSSLITKVYFPRVLLPAATVVAGLMDLAVSAALLVVLMVYYHAQIHVDLVKALLLTPLFIAMTLLVTLGSGMLMAALNVRYRDVKYVVPFLLQIGMFATPIAYPLSSVPERYRLLFALNPFCGIVDGLRSCLFAHPMDLPVVGTSVAVSVALFLAGAYYFHQTERSFADII
jgi:lipopolysaccharide transport system permease protein